MIITYFLGFFWILCIILIMHEMEELYEMKISHPILEQRFFESNTNRNKC